VNRPLRLSTFAAAAALVATGSTTLAEQSSLARTFWAGVDYLGLVFKSVGSLGGGADHGQVWIFDLATGGRRQATSADDLSWPVLAPDDTTIFALRGKQAMRASLKGGDVAPFGPSADWRKLAGVDGDGDVLGFVAARPQVRPAVMNKNGELLLLPQPESDEEKERVSILLQENQAYANGRKLIVMRSERGGRGYDVKLEDAGSIKNVSDCGDDACGQPSLSPDGRLVLYIRAAPK
jgi:hypothetical protein